ncbi:hypothetical protein RRG08_049519 [Elysia crispata]|uniref:Uncharacterized protein n=1 Tax=Elysia crispata TaxID=231223 RepID=A0AAE0ZEI0_9GAST|nr:hypothetical protein RRG08_049519 [Elysia crispata]
MMSIYPRESGQHLPFPVASHTSTGPLRTLRVKLSHLTTTLSEPHEIRYVPSPSLPYLELVIAVVCGRGQLASYV